MTKAAECCSWTMADVAAYAKAAQKGPEEPQPPPQQQYQTAKAAQKGCGKVARKSATAAAQAETAKSAATEVAFEDDGWTIVKSKSRIKDTHIAPKKRFAAEARASHYDDTQSKEQGKGRH